MEPQSPWDTPHYNTPITPHPLSTTPTTSIPPQPRSAKQYSENLPTEVIPRLFLSDISTAESAATLSLLGITHVLSAMRGYVALPRAALPHLQWLQIPLDDLPFAELAAHLPTTTAFIENALADPRARVLVHCHAGVSRSTSVVCGYLISRYGWTARQAVQYIKMRRRVAEPNFGFMAQLHEYKESLGQGPPSQ